MMLTVRDIEELIFCPRLFYYHVVLGIERKKGFWSETGKIVESELREKTIQRLSNEYDLIDIDMLEDSKYKIRYKPDLLLRHKKYKFYVIGDIKNSSKVKPEFLGTLYVYAFLLERQGFFPIKRAFLVLNDESIHWFEIGDHERMLAKFYLESAIKILKEGKIPKGNLRNCSLCDLREVCRNEEN